MHQFDRALGIILRLRTGKPYSASSLARHFAVSTRTIYRDIESLSALGVPIYAQRGRGGGLRLLEGYFLPPLTFTQDEALALAVALALLASLRAKPFAADLASAEAKIAAAVPDPLRHVLASLERHIGFEGLHEDIFHPEPPGQDASIEAEAPQDRTSQASLEEDVVTSFVQAIVKQTLLSVRYRSPYRDQPEELTVEPLGTFWDRGFWYLVGQESGTARTPRLWRADRVVSVHQEATAVDKPGDFDVRSYLGRRWLASAMRRWAEEAPVRVRLTSQQAERLRRDWYYRHAEAEALPNGDVAMTFGESDREIVLDLVRWLGPGAELIEPSPWRSILREQLVHMLDRYRAAR
jgi:predicted DNA-binding transcriptional regulator YafY